MSKSIPVFSDPAHTLSARVAVVTNIPAPYRLPMYELLAAAPGIELKLFFCSSREPDREWDLQRLGVPHTYLRERLVTWHARFIHINPDVWRHLRSFRPTVVVTTGFNPTHLLAFLYAGRYGARHVAMTDGTVMSESRLSPLHSWVRRAVYRATSAFVGASEGSFALYRQYGIAAEATFKSHLCANNAAFLTAAEAAEVPKDFDVIFCGRFVEGKLPMFAIEVCAATAKLLHRRVRLLLVGSGELDASMRGVADRSTDLIEAHFAGFARQAELPGLYLRARVALFPTVGDTWGVVANEACAAGLPVIVSPQAGVADDLVRDGENGRVLPIEVVLWAKAVAELLTDDALRRRMSECSLERVRPYTYANAADGLAAAIEHATRGVTGAAPPNPAKGRRVVLMQRRMTHYRVSLFERMRDMLAAQGIVLEVIYGDPLPGEALKRDAGALPWGRHVRCRYWFGGQLCWQWAWPAIRHADLVIVTQENKLLLNYFLQLSRFRVPLALWGHGRNFQSTSPMGLRERIKRVLARRADWWFAYTERSAEVVRALGFAPQQITVVNNSTDLTALQHDLDSLGDADDHAWRGALRLGSGPVALVLASLYADKRIDFTVAAMRRARERVPDLQLLIVGDGPDRPGAQASTQGLDWVHWAGARTGLEKARCLRVATLMLNPFALGLVVLDSFIAGVPIVATASAGHGPEFAYLKNGTNCVITESDADAFADAVCALLEDQPRRAALAQAGISDATELTLEHMARRFCDGIDQCMAARAGRLAGAVS